jgi:hypothetical protein
MVCVASAAETGNISAKPSTAVIAKRAETKAVSQSKKTSRKPVDVALTRHTSSFHGPPGPTLTVGARYVSTPTAGLSKSWLDSSGQISEGEFLYDWPPGAKILSAAPVEIAATAPPVATVAPTKAAPVPVTAVRR